MNTHYLILKLLLQQILRDVINAIVEFVRRILRLFLLGEDFIPYQEEASHSEPFE